MVLATPAPLYSFLPEPFGAPLPVIGLGTLVATALLRWVLVPKLAVESSDIPPWVLFWVLSKLSVLCAVLLLLFGALLEWMLTASTVSFHALIVVLFGYAMYLLFGQSAINIANIVHHRYRRASK